MTDEQQQQVELLILNGATQEEIKAYIWRLTIETLDENVKKDIN